MDPHVFILLSLTSQVAKRAALTGNDADMRDRRRAYECDATGELIYIHPESCMFNEYVVYALYRRRALCWKE